MPKSSLRAKVFWLVSRLAHTLYPYFPVFGTIRGSVAIIRRDNGFLVIERNDGYGLSFPGGIARFHEPPETTLRREVQEETGLTIADAQLKFDYLGSKPFRIHTYVFEVSSSGDIRASWEGTPIIVSFSELRERVVAQQRPVVDYLISANQKHS